MFVSVDSRSGVVLIILIVQSQPKVSLGYKYVPSLPINLVLGPVFMFMSHRVHTNTNKLGQTTTTTKTFNYNCYIHLAWSGLPQS